MNGKSQIKIGIVLSYVATGVNSLITLAYTPLIIRLLGKSEYGLYNISNSIVSYLGILSYGFSNAFIRFYSRAKQDGNEREVARVNAIFFLIFCAIGIIAIVAGGIVVVNLDFFFGAKFVGEELKRLKILVTILIVNIGLTFLSYVFEANVMANERFFFQKVIYIIKIGLNPFVALPLVLYGLGSYGLVIATLIMTIVNLVVNIWYCKNKLNIQFCFHNLNWNILKEIATFSSYIFLNVVVDQVNWNLDQLILGARKGSSNVAVYSAGAQLNTCYLALASTVSSVYIPKVYKMVLKGENKQISDLFIAIGRIQFMILGTIISGFVLFGKFFMTNIFAGNGYENSYYVAICLMLPATIPYMQLLGIEIQRAKNLHQFRSIVYAVIAFVNGFISFLICPFGGEIGCAAITGVSVFIGPGIIMNWYNAKYVKLNITKFWKEIFKLLPIFICCFILGIVIQQVLPIKSIGIFFVEGILFVGIITILLWIFALNKEEKRAINRMIFRGNNNVE